MVVSILGCGWLGSALGQHLASNGFKVKGSVTNPEKMQGLSAMGIEGFIIRLNEKTLLDVESDFWNSDALVLASNVNLQGNDGYVESLKELAKIIAVKKVKRVIILSSTSVYGEPNDMVDERSTLAPKTASAARLLEIESIFQDIKETNTTVIRFGGLVGPGRMPGSFLSGKQNISNGLAPVNLIHLGDCIGIIESLLNISNKIDILNAVSPDHPSRYQFYTTAARAQGLPLPEFLLEKKSWKVVRSIVIDQWGYEYQVNNWESWLRDAN
jgi:nucleoside-diphosphate-sugar epimerase